MHHYVLCSEEREEAADDRSGSEPASGTQRAAPAARTDGAGLDPGYGRVKVIIISFSAGDWTPPIGPSDPWARSPPFTASGLTRLAGSDPLFDRNPFYLDGDCIKFVVIDAVRLTLTY